MSHPDLSTLLAHPALWQAGRPPAGAARPVLPSGHAALDAALADGGWPRGALSELLADGPGQGALPLLLPALATHATAGGWVVLVSPPFVPLAGAWQAAGVDPRRLLVLTPPEARAWLWSAEQAARTAGCAVLAWQGKNTPGLRELRRLQLAAQEAGGVVALLRPLAARGQSSPAALRLALATPPNDRGRGQMAVEVLKQRGGHGGRVLVLPLHARHAHPRLPAWQLPVHRPGAPATTPDNAIDSAGNSRAVAGHPLSRPPARALDAQPSLPGDDG